jgi:uncharacterized membrane protein
MTIKKIIDKVNYNNILKPEIVVTVLILIFGITFIFLIKPLEIPDEGNQFLRAYGLSDGKLLAGNNTKDGCIAEGGKILYGKNQLQNSLPDSVASFITQNINGYNEQSLLKSKLNPSNRVSVCSTQTELNSPIGYMPQILAILLLKIFNTPPIIMDYVARLFILIAWSIIIYFAIKTIPVRKWSIGAIALLPISIQQSISISPDALTTSIVALMVAYVVRSYYEDRERKFTKDLIIITILSSLATLSKPVAIATIILIPLYFSNILKKSKRKRMVILKIIAIFIPVASYLLWSLFIASHNISINSTFILAYQKSQFFKTSLFNELKLFFRDSKNYILYGIALSQFGSFEWFTKSFPHLFDYLGVAGLVIILIVSYDQRKMLKNVTNRQLKILNLGIIFTSIGLFVATLFALFIIWTPIGAKLIYGIQFRYFLPTFIILAAISQTKFLRSSAVWYKNFTLVYSLIFFVASVLTLTGILKIVI